MLSQKRDVDFGNDGAVVADDAGEQFFAVGQHAQEVIVNFLLDGLGFPACAAQLGQRAGFSSGGNVHLYFASRVAEDDRWPVVTFDYRGKG